MLKSYTVDTVQLESWTEHIKLYEQVMVTIVILWVTVMFSESSRMRYGYVSNKNKQYDI
jgi:hypothetical protein